MSKTTLKIKATADSKIFSVAIDEKKLSFSDGEASVKLDEGKTHALNWFIMGNVGDKYSIKIIEPESAKFEVSAKLDSSKKDAGLHWIEL